MSFVVVYSDITYYDNVPENERARIGSSTNVLPVCAICTGPVVVLVYLIGTCCVIVE